MKRYLLAECYTEQLTDKYTVALLCRDRIVLTHGYENLWDVFYPVKICVFCISGLFKLYSVSISHANKNSPRISFHKIIIRNYYTLFLPVCKQFFKLNYPLSRRQM